MQVAAAHFENKSIFFFFFFFFEVVKIENFKIKNDIFLILTQNIDLGYLLKPPTEVVLADVRF